MNYVSFIPIGRRAEARPDETILDVARRAGVPLGNACGGTGVCGRCRVTIVEGEASLTEPTSVEGKVEEAQRLACQAVVRGCCTVTTPYW
ncbi:MAG TPA: 2Fe-2S iron-sulfur cluster-binding protein [Thermoanaerobaculia bacterium]|nr:2Fe-2S iron-sulfur cluster-binding protein [Thermoanaerobaculia bacterium]